MKTISRIATAAALALVVSSGSAFAFNNGGWGGHAKYFAGNASGATGHVYAKSKKYGCGCEQSGKFNITNASEQYNSSYKKVKWGSKTVGGESGGRNSISANWKNANVKAYSNSGAFGASGISNKRF